MIDPQFLADLRHRKRAEQVLLLVQLEQVAPGWWETLNDLAEQLGTDRATLNRGLRKLERDGLIRRYSISNRSGTWVWWVKRHAKDEPKPEDEPAWVLKLTTSNHFVRIPISGRREWASSRGIPLQTLIGFLNGRQTVLRNKWKLSRSPFDLVESRDAA